MNIRVIESVQHFVFTQRSVDPVYVCTGRCKRVFWHEDFVPGQQGPVFVCQACGGTARVAIQGSDFSVLSPLQYAKLGPGGLEHLKELREWTYGGTVISSAHWVKPDFVALAKREWCPNGLEYTTEINYDH